MQARGFRDLVDSDPTCEGRRRHDESLFPSAGIMTCIVALAKGNGPPRANKTELSSIASSLRRGEAVYVE